MLKKVNDIKLKRLQREFLPEALEIIEKPASPIGHLVIWLIISIIIAVVLWSVFGTVDEIVTARGKVITTDGVQIVQSQNAGMIDRICVKEGDSVKKGDVLIVLNTESEQGSLVYNSTNLEELEYKMQLLDLVIMNEKITENHLESEFESIYNYICSIQETRDSEIKQYELNIDTTNKQIEIEETELAILNEQKQNLTNQKLNMEKNYSKTGTEKQKLEVLEKQINGCKEEVDTYKKLYKQGAVAKIEYTNKKNELRMLEEERRLQNIYANNEAEGRKENLTKLENDIHEAENRINLQTAKLNQVKDNCKIAKETLQAFLESSNNEIYNLIEETRIKIKDSELALEHSEILVRSQELIAPCDGIVQTLYKSMEKGVAAPAQEMVAIVPNQNELIMEANVLNRDIGLIQLGQDASVKIDAYNFQKYGKLNATVTYISQDAFLDEKQGYVYKVKLELDQNEGLKEEDLEQRIDTGMEGSLEVKTGKKKIIEFFFEPLISYFDNSLKI